MNSDDILKIHNLKNTGCRKHIINELLGTQTALSESEIKTALPDLFDRVTFYRSLKILEEKNIIHRIVLHDTTIKYALNKLMTDDINHVHYHCTNCNDVTCGTISITEKLHPTNGFSIQTADVVLEGICENCNSKK